MSEALLASLPSYQLNGSPVSVWHNFQRSTSFNVAGRVTSISVSGQHPYKYAVPSGFTIEIYKSSNDKLLRKISGFSKRVECCAFRNDGKLIGVGEEGGILRICTTDKHTLHLRKMEAHEGALRKVEFFLDNLRISSLGEDAFIRIWDVATGRKISHYALGSGKESGKAMCLGRLNNNIVASGNMAGNIFIYDTRQRKPVHRLMVYNGITSLKFAHNDNFLVAASGTFMNVWDLSANAPFFPSAFVAQPDYQQNEDDTAIGIRRHYKLITDLCIANYPGTITFKNSLSRNEFVISAGMDRLIKFTSLHDFSELHTLRAPSTLLSVGITPDSRKIIIGCENGIVKTFCYKAKRIDEDTGSKREDDQIISPSRPALSSGSLELVGSLGGDLDSLVGLFSGRWRGGGQLGHEALISVDDWLSRPLEQVRPAPNDWLLKKRSESDIKTPFVFSDTEISRYSTLTELWRRLSPAERAVRGRLLRVDHLLRRFEHSRALAQAFLPTRVRQTTLKAGRKRRGHAQLRTVDSHATGCLVTAVVQELERRGCLEAAVAGNTPAQLSRLLRFVAANVHRREVATTCLQLYNKLIDLYPVDKLLEIPEFKMASDLINKVAENLTVLLGFSESLRRANLPSDPSEHSSLLLSPPSDSISAPSLPIT